MVDLASVRQELAEIQAQARRPPTEDFEGSALGPPGEAGTAPSTLRSTRGIPKSQVCCSGAVCRASLHSVITCKPCWCALLPCGMPEKCQSSCLITDALTARHSCDCMGAQLLPSVQIGSLGVVGMTLPGVDVLIPREWPLLEEGLKQYHRLLQERAGAATQVSALMAAVQAAAGLLHCSCGAC